MTTYLNDTARLALCDFIADSELLCGELGIPADPFVGMVTVERVAFELGARFDVWAEHCRPIIQFDRLRERLLDAYPARR